MRVFAVLCVAFLAGCVADRVETPSGPGEGAPSVPSFGQREIAGGGGELEVTLLLAGSTGLVCQMGAAETDIVYASADAGATWRRLPIDRGLRSSSDCDLAIGPEGNWYVVFLDVVDEEIFGNGFTNGVLTFGTSRDQGSTWTWTTLPGFTNGLVDRPWIRVLDDGTIYLTHKSGNFLPLTVYFQTSTDAGATWSEPVLAGRVTDPARPNGNVGRMVLLDQGRTILVPIHTFDSRQGEGRDEWLDLLVSEDDGRTWAVRPIVGPLRLRADSFLPSLAATQNGTLYAAVPLANGSKQADLAFVVSQDRGTSWSEVVPLASGQEYTARRAQASVALDAGPEGVMDAAWYHWRDGWIVSVARLSGTDVVWSQEVTEPEGVEAQLEFLSIQHDAGGGLVVAYSLPMDPCAEHGGRDCIALVRERHEGRPDAPNGADRKLSLGKGEQTDRGGPLRGRSSTAA